MLSFEGGGMGFRRTILLTRLSFWTISTRNGRRKKGWRIGRTASRSRLNTREAACWLGQRESSSRPTTLLNRHRLIFSSKFDWFFASNPLILHCQSFIFFILLVAISIIRCSLRSTSNQSWGGSKLSHQQSLDLPLPGQQIANLKQVENGGEGFNLSLYYRQYFNRQKELLNLRILPRCFLYTASQITDLS